MRDRLVLVLLVSLLAGCGSPADKPEPTMPAVEGQRLDVARSDLVGDNLQDAQDELQALGSYLLDQVDATGKGRNQVLDAHWRVCAQRPAPGKAVPVTTVVTLTSVKLDEKCP